MLDRWAILLIATQTSRLNEWRELLYAFTGYVNRPHEWITYNTYVLVAMKDAFSEN